MDAQILTFPPRLRAVCHDPAAARAVAQFAALGSHPEVTGAERNARNLLESAIQKALKALKWQHTRAALRIAHGRWVKAGDFRADFHELETAMSEVAELVRQAERMGGATTPKGAA